MTREVIEKVSEDADSREVVHIGQFSSELALKGTLLDLMFHSRMFVEDGDL